MPKIVDHNQYRAALLNAAVKAGAKYGLGGITNQAVAEMCGQPEAYIYRYFFDRDDLIRRAFLSCDENFFGELSKHLDVLREESLPPKERFFKFMDVSWDYMVDDYDYCNFYVQYYYSAYFTPDLRAEHRKTGMKFFSQVKDRFQEEISVDKLMHQLFSAVLWNVMDMAVGMTEDTPAERAEIFGAMYSYIEKHLKVKD